VYDLNLPAASFDAVALVGVIEHMPDHHRAMSIAARLLRRDGPLYVSASCYRSQAMLANYSERPASQHVTGAVFGYGVMRPMSALIEAAEDAGLSLSGITDLTAHYRRTVADWLERVQAASARIDALVPGYSSQLARYLEITNAGWGRTTKHYAFTAVRSRLGRTEVPR
jgi:cyclopropane-fatty-acyl-phospholipid synthase